MPCSLQRTKTGGKKIIINETQREVFSFRDPASSSERRILSSSGDHHKQTTLNKDIDFTVTNRMQQLLLLGSCSCQEMFILTQSLPMFNVLGWTTQLLLLRRKKQAFTGPRLFYAEKLRKEGELC